MVANIVPTGLVRPAFPVAWNSGKRTQTKFVSSQSRNVNQQSSGKDHGTLGFINAAIYGIGLGSSYAADFQDITSGSNGTYST